MAYNFKILILIGLLLISGSGLNVFSQQPKKNTIFFDPAKRFSFSLYGEYVSSGQLQSNIRSSDPFQRSSSIDLKGGFGYGGEINYIPSFLNHELTFYLSTEYFKIDETDLALRFEQDTVSEAVSLEEKLSLIPIELGVKWNLPVGTENFKIYIGGGGGLYFGDRERVIAGLFHSHTISKTPGFSLNVLTGMLLYIAQNLAANFELKFREAAYDVQSGFDLNTIYINGYGFSLENPIYSRIIIDGVRVSLGLKYNF